MKASVMQLDFNRAPVHQREGIYHYYAYSYRTTEQNISRAEDQAQRRCLFAMERILHTNPRLNIEYHDIYPTAQSRRNQERITPRQHPNAQQPLNPFSTIFVNLLLFLIWLPFHAMHMMLLAILHVNDIYTIRNNPRMYRKYAGSQNYRYASAWFTAALAFILIIACLIAWG